MGGDNAHSTGADRFQAVIIVSASGKENVGKENRGFVIFLSYIFLSAGLDGRKDDHGPISQARIKICARHQGPSNALRTRISVRCQASNGMRRIHCNCGRSCHASRSCPTGNRRATRSAARRLRVARADEDLLAVGRDGDRARIPRRRDESEDDGLAWVRNVNDRDVVVVGVGDVES